MPDNSKHSDTATPRNLISVDAARHDSESATITYIHPSAEQDTEDALPTHNLVTVTVPLQTLFYAMSAYALPGANAASGHMTTYVYEGFRSELGAIPVSARDAKALLPRPSKYYASVRNDGGSRLMVSVPCTAGHHAPRYAASRRCVVCSDIGMVTSNLLNKTAPLYRPTRVGLPSHAPIYCTLLKAMGVALPDGVDPRTVRTPLDTGYARRTIKTMRKHLVNGSRVNAHPDAHDPLPVLDTSDPAAVAAAQAQAYSEIMHALDAVGGASEGYAIKPEYADWARYVWNAAAAAWSECPPYTVGEA